MQNSILLEGSDLSVAPVSVEETKKKFSFAIKLLRLQRAVDYYSKNWGLHRFNES